MISSRDFSDWMKLPNAIEHYLHHSEEDNLSFAAFFKIHYMDDVKFDEDYEQDMDLPFKTDSGSLQSVLTNVLIPSGHAYSIPVFTEEFVANRFGYFSMSITDSYSSTIWQPPKQA